MTCGTAARARVNATRGRGETIISSVCVPGACTEDSGKHARLYLARLSAVALDDEFAVSKARFLDEQSRTRGYSAMPFPFFQVRGEGGLEVDAFESRAFVLAQTIGAAFYVPGSCGRRVQWFAGHFVRPLCASKRQWEVQWSDATLSECDLNPCTYGSRWVILKRTPCATWLADEQRVRGAGEGPGTVVLLVRKLTELQTSTNSTCMWWGYCDVARSAIETYERESEAEETGVYIGDASELLGAEVVRNGDCDVLGTVRGAVGDGRACVWKVEFKNDEDKKTTVEMRWRELLAGLHRLPPFRFDGPTLRVQSFGRDGLCRARVRAGFAGGGGGGVTCIARACKQRARVRAGFACGVARACKQRARVRVGFCLWWRRGSDLCRARMQATSARACRPDMVQASCTWCCTSACT